MLKVGYNGRVTDKPLSKKHELFVTNLILCKLNATEAYVLTYPKITRDVARVNASRLLSNANIQNAVQERLKEVHMSADEALMLQADIARGDITELLTPLGNVDINEIRKSGKGRLIKKIKQRTITKIGKKDTDEDTEIHETEIELYPADTAQINILKIQGKFKETIDLTSGGEKIKGYIGWSPNEWKKDEEK